ncbi:MAG TPA: hypothetical protein VEP73_12815 [Actinomycetota bacterium]|nr:hypothetical protein [Actinomycetota bacterium]
MLLTRPLRALLAVLTATVLAVATATSAALPRSKHWLALRSKHWAPAWRFANVAALSLAVALLAVIAYQGDRFQWG